MEQKQDTIQQEMLEMIRFIYDNIATKEDIAALRRDMATKQV